MSHQVAAPTTFRWRVVVGMACAVGGAAVIAAGLLNVGTTWFAVSELSRDLDAGESTRDAALSAVVLRHLLPGIVAGLAVGAVGLLLARGRWRTLGALEGVVGGVVGGFVVTVVVWLGTGLLVSLIWPPATL